ncbi:MAG: membrane protease subunit HflK [Lentimonas sp.]|jgi:membrane protease subunit HflK
MHRNSPPPINQNPLDDINWDALKQYRKLLIILPILLLLIAGALSSFYIVQPEEEAVVKRFGKVIAQKDPGLHFKLPFNIDTAQMVPTARVLKQEFGFRTSSVDGRTSYRKDQRHQDESLMLTGDLKVIDVEWVVQYRVSDPDAFLHKVRDPEQTLRDVSEAVMRQIVGNSLGSDVLTEKRVEVAANAKQELQKAMEHFELGIQISTIELQDVTPPGPVKPAFNEVNQAEQERERFINEAEKRRNQVIPRAEGQAQQVIAEAQGYAARRINAAKGESERFTAIYEAYLNAPQVTRERMYLEMIDKVLPKAGKIYIMEKGQNAPLPLLNIGSGSTQFPTAK